MLKSKLVMDEFIVTSSYTPEEICKLHRYTPEVLQIISENGDVDFIYDCRKGNGAISAYGIIFNTVDSEGKAALRVCIPPDFVTINEKKQWFAETFGPTILKANEIESEMIATLSSIDESIANLMEQLEVIA